ncbi:MAG: hypothetical protein HY718_01235, partial [Planctomycetes bacterium]|nr:hypothetical protein [Planctomycetota bacterium]
MMIAAQTDLDVVRPSCELCGGGRSRHLWTLSFPGRPDPFRLFRCGGCGVVFNHPRLSVDLIHGQYDGDYYVFHERPERRWSRATQLYVEHLLG